MLLPPWFWLTLIALIFFGFAGLLQKLSTDQISAESALIWLIVGFVILQPWLYAGKTTWNYSPRSMTFIILAGILNALGSWAVLAAMKSGGKAAIVVPLTAVYPMVVVAVAPFVLRETITPLQGVGILCGLGAIFLLST